MVRAGIGSGRGEAAPSLALSRVQLQTHFAFNLFSSLIAVFSWGFSKAFNCSPCWASLFVCGFLPQRHLPLDLVLQQEFQCYLAKSLVGLRFLPLNPWIWGSDS